MMASKHVLFNLLVGGLLITIGFVMLLNFDITEWDSKHFFKAKLNVGELLQMVKRFNDNTLNDTKAANLEHDFHTILNNLDVDSYLYFYCQLSKKPMRMWVYHPKQEFPIPTRNQQQQQSTTSSTDQKRLLEEELKEALVNKKFYLKNFYSFIICKSEKVYMAMIICCTFIGSLFMLCGCVQLYLGKKKPAALVAAGKINGPPEEDDVASRAKLLGRPLKKEMSCPFNYEELPAFLISNQLTNKPQLMNEGSPIPPSSTIPCLYEATVPNNRLNDNKILLSKKSVDQFKHTVIEAANNQDYVF